MENKKKIALMIALVFLLTGLGIFGAAFWESRTQQRNSPASTSTDQHAAADSTKLPDDFTGASGRDSDTTCDTVLDNLKILGPRSFGGQDCQRIGGSWSKVVDRNHITNYALVPTTARGADDEGSLLNIFCMKARCMVGLELAPSEQTYASPDTVLFLTAILDISGKQYSTKDPWKISSAHTRAYLVMMSTALNGITIVRGQGFGFCDVIRAQKIELRGTFESGNQFSIDFDPTGIDRTMLDSSIRCKQGD